MNRILIDLSPMLQGGANGGAKIFIIDLLNNLLPKLNFKIDLIIDNEFSEKHLFMSYCNIIKLNNFSKKKEFIFSKIFFFSKKYDILFAPFGDSNFDNKAKKSIYILYDLQHIYYPQFFSKDELLRRQKRYKKIISNKNIILISISNYSKADFENNFGKKNKIIASPIGFEFKKYQKEFNFDLKKFDIKSKSYFIYPANLWKHKNHEVLILAFKMFLNKNKNSNFKLILTGASVDRKKELTEFITKLNLQNDIIFTGYLKENEILSLIKNSFSVVYPTLFEGFGIPIFESIILKTPVICSDLKVLKEILGDGNYYFDQRKPYDIFLKMDQLYNSQNFYNFINDEIKKNSSLKNNHPNMIEKYLKTINEQIS